jgi:hypothetical protein
MYNTQSLDTYALTIAAPNGWYEPTKSSTYVKNGDSETITGANYMVSAFSANDTVCIGAEASTAVCASTLTF